MNELTTFTNEQFGTMRTVIIDGEPWFAGKDVAAALGYSDTKSALADHVDGEDKKIIQRGQIATLDIPNCGLTFINESGLYSLVLSSKLPSAKAFKRWVTAEVIPSIRKNGGYIANQDKLSETELIAKALLVAKNVIESQSGELKAERARNEVLEENNIQLKEKIAELTPKARFAEMVTASKNAIPMDAMAKLITQNGLKIGRNELYWFLREMGYLIKTGASRNLPTQYAMEKGWFEVDTVPYRSSEGKIEVNLVTRVSGKGQEYLIHLLCD